jgi:hypothetical protein
MCGRFTQNLSWEELQRLADLIGQPRNLAPRYNIAPTTQIEVIRPTADGNELTPMRWGLVPSWWKKPLNELPSTFNARAETVAEKPMFRAAFKSRRCIIPASGFYEWTAPASPWQNAFAERLIGSIRRECVDHLIVLSERHLRRILRRYADYYNGVRTHRSLNKDAPISRGVQRIGAIKSRALLGLHHHYVRI